MTTINQGERVRLATEGHKEVTPFGSEGSQMGKLCSRQGLSNPAISCLGSLRLTLSRSCNRSDKCTPIDLATLASARSMLSLP